MGPIPRARRQHGDLSGSCCCSLLSARAVAARLAIRPSIIRCTVEHRSAVSTGLVRAICSIIHSAAAAELAVDQVRVPQLRGAPRSACALKTGCRRPSLRHLVCSGARHRSAVSMGLVRAICSIIHSAAAAELAVDQVRVPQLRGAPRSACALKTGCRRPSLRPLVCSEARRGSPSVRCLSASACGG